MPNTITVVFVINTQAVPGRI